MRLALLALGIAAGVLTSNLLAACGCSFDVNAPIPTGRFVPVDSASADTDYSVVISSDRTNVTESFTRDGAEVVITYEVH